MLLLFLFFWSEVDHFLIKGWNANSYVGRATGRAGARFSKEQLLEFHSPKIAAVGLGVAKTYALKKFPIR